MNRPATRLFHLHFNAPDVPSAENRLAAHLPLRRRFGAVDGEFTALDADEEVPEDFRLRLQTHQRGYANVTLAPGRRPHFDHLGLCTADFDAVLARVEEVGWSIRDPEGRRPFVMTPWGFRVEVHRDGSEVESELGAWSDGHLSAVGLAVPEPDAVRDGLASVFGEVPGLAVESGERGRAWVPEFRLEGGAYPDGLVVETAALLR